MNLLLALTSTCVSNKIRFEMRFIADFHIHSRYSRATSRDLDLEHLELWARRKGLAVVGTGDFTHPEWFSELKERLEPAEPGLFRLKKDYCIKDDPWVPESPLPVRFILSAEISNIYKKGEKVRKVHNLIMAPDFESAEKISLSLGRIGNIKSDGRPILGLDSRDLLEIVLESSEDSCFIPAHIWTPWFSILGSKSGFDSVEECFDDLTPHIFALETGLSSDPPMNWRLSSLDKFSLVSNSDAHSPGNLGREANVFDVDISYFAMREALKDRDPEKYLGTIEFFPQEGKYHYDGHRKCNVCMEPVDTKKNRGLCPVCGRAVTVGVSHRVEDLADREHGHRPEGPAPFRSLIPLNEIISEIMGVGKASKRVGAEYFRLIKELGPELEILERMPLEKISAESGILAKAIERMRHGKVIIREGYDGEYGVIKLFGPEELKSLGPQKGLFTGQDPGARKKERKVKKAAKEISKDKTKSQAPSLILEKNIEGPPVISDLNPEQEKAVKADKGPVMIVAGPGTGKTRTLTHRIAYLIRERGLAPERTLAVTFTNKAKEEMEERLSVLIPAPGSYRRIIIRTFHGLGLMMMKEEAKALGIGERFVILAEDSRIELMKRIIGTGSSSKAREALAWISDAKQKLLLPEDVEGHDLGPVYRSFREEMRSNGAMDFDDLLMFPVRLMRENEESRNKWRSRFDSISIDEYQDINQAQYEMVRLLSPTGENLCVIGDPDQSIYGFRGAEAAYFMKFPEDYPGARVFGLERNYRSSESILKASRQVISRLDNPHRPSLFSDTPGPRLSIAELASDKAEAEFVVHQIERMVGGTGFFSLDSGRVESGEGGREMSFSDFAVLYRMEALSGPLAEAFERSGMPFQRVGDDPFAREEVKRIVSVLSIILNPACGVLSRSPGLAGIHDKLRDEIEYMRKDAGRVPVVDLVERAFELDHPSPAGQEITRARKFLLERAAPFGTRLDEFLESAALSSPQDFYDARADRVALSTLHAAKGLEFEAVFIVGCEDGIIPYTRAGASNAEIEEERRVFYVGVTRAKRLLYLTRSRRRALFGPVRSRPASPFLKDIEEDLTRSAALPSRKSKKEKPQLKLF